MDCADPIWRLSGTNIMAKKKLKPFEVSPYHLENSILHFKGFKLKNKRQIKLSSFFIKIIDRNI
jgi:hypothetical protein